MKKQILLVSASPRKGGNSDTLCDAFLKGSQEAGHIAEKLFLRQYQIHYCSGCGTCNQTHTCVQKDDMKDILDKMIQADVIVLSTPVYFYSMDAQLKTLIDRTVPRYQEIANKEFYFLLSVADTEKHMLERTVEGLRGFTQDCLPGSVERGILYGTGAWQKGDAELTGALQQAYELGKAV